MSTRRYSSVIAVAVLVSAGAFAGVYLRGEAARRAMGAPPRSLESALVAGNWGEVDARAESWMKKDGFTPEAAVLRGYAALRRRDATAAAAHFSRARFADTRQLDWAISFGKARAGSPAAQLIAGDAYARKGDSNTAIECFTRSISMDPGNSAVRLAKATALTSAGDKVGAAKELDTLRDDKLAAEVLVLRSWLHLATRDTVSAMNELNAAVGLAPRHAVAFNTRGVAAAQAGRWAEAAGNFETAFRLAPDMVEARQNWQIAKVAAIERGTLISERMTQGNITIVSSGDRQNLTSITAATSEMISAKHGFSPPVVQNVEDALRLSRSGDVILQVPGSGLRATAGEEMRRTLNTIGSRAPVSIVTGYYEAADNATMGVLRHMSGRDPSQRASIKSFQIVDPSEMSGLVGKTGFGNTDLKTVAGRAGDIASKGVNVAVYTTEGKIGSQHVGNVSTFKAVGEITTYVTPWKGGVETSVGLSPKAPFVSPTMGIGNAKDKASNRNDLGPRDWTVYSHGTQRNITSTFAGIGQKYVGAYGPGSSDRSTGGSLGPGGLKGDFQRSVVSSISGIGQKYTGGSERMIWNRDNSANRGGVSLGPVNLARGNGGRVAFASKGENGGDLLLVSTIFGADREAVRKQ